MECRFSPLNVIHCLLTLNTFNHLAVKKYPLLTYPEEYPNPEMTISLRTALKITIQSVGHVLSEVVNLAHTSVPEGEIMTLTTQWHNHCLSTYMYFFSV